ncbi:MAG TPA: succinate dehydrogenase cytochrome b subunit [Planctomycetes bacterium]|nr:succinate dehydrogenase cytochrome b subunit [Planctomycetota bacterium]HIK61095.1 succinate dehydrogenase cytochrome b subunit [Planctomycetota bacterium]
MPSWIGRFLSSSVGKKTVMAVTGLSLVGFLVAHLLGNFSLYTGGIEGFNEYAAKLEDLGGLLMAAEVVLFAVFVIHVSLALRIVRENRLARDEAYRVRATMGNSTRASRSMAITGLVVLLFLIVHIIDFRVPTLVGDMDNLGAAVVERLGSPVGATVYLIGILALGLHLRHAIQSAFQSLGIQHPQWTPILRVGALALAAALAIGFASFPIYCLLSQGAASAGVN